MRSQECPVPFEILAVENGCTDDTRVVLEELAAEPGASLRHVTEKQVGIVPARNRAIEEALDSDILVFIDDDELPEAGLLSAAHDAIVNEGAQCVGGPIEVDFGPYERPVWMPDELLGFLGQVDYGDLPLWIKGGTTPFFTGNIAYDVRLFREDRNLRFDRRYNRKGGDIGGGEDGIMFRTLLAKGVSIRYRPDMAVIHAVEPWRLKRRYFLKLHYRAGKRYGLYEMPDYSRTVLGMPPFLIAQVIRQCLKYAVLQFVGRRDALRQAMNAAHAAGSLIGYKARSAT